MPELDAAAVVRVLNEHTVEYVVIGGISAHLNDLPVPATVDIDVGHGSRSSRPPIARGIWSISTATTRRSIGTPTADRRVPFRASRIVS